MSEYKIKQFIYSHNCTTLLYKSNANIPLLYSISVQMTYYYKIITRLIGVQLIFSLLLYYTVTNNSGLLFLNSGIYSIYV